VLPTVRLIRVFQDMRDLPVLGSAFGMRPKAG
jgi:hypothetical protein